MLKPDTPTVSSWCDLDDAGCVQVQVRWTHEHDRDGSGRATVEVTDSKLEGSPVLRFTADEWAAFCEGVRDGEFDLDLSGPETPVPVPSASPVSPRRIISRPSP